jgi:hypothetical protein
LYVAEMAQNFRLLLLLEGIKKPKFASIADVIFTRSFRSCEDRIVANSKSLKKKSLPLVLAFRL